jgi:hypothetical protein
MGLNSPCLTIISRTKDQVPTQVGEAKLSECGSLPSTHLLPAEWYKPHPFVAQLFQGQRSFVGLPLATIFRAFVARDPIACAKQLNIGSNDLS